MGERIALGILILIAAMLAVMGYGIYTSQIYVTP